METRSRINIGVTSIILFSILILFNCKKEPLKVAPTVTMTPVTNITSVSASTGGNVTADGGASVTSRGICWSATNKTPTTADGNVGNGSGLGSFTSPITGLTPGTTYYVNAYATNGIGTSFSSTSTFTTLALAPSITTTELFNITTNTATSGGNIPNDGGSPVTARGVCWSTSQNPTIADSKTNDGTGIGSFTSSLTNLVPGSTYYVRAYATNSVASVYGNQVSIVLPKFKNYLRSSYYLKESEIWVDYYKMAEVPHGSPNCGNGIADFNGDGYDDVLIPNGFQYTRLPLELYLNDGSNKNFKLDNTIIKNNIGAENARKAVIGDFNKDGKPDVFYADHGYEPQNSPFLFAYPSILMSTSNGYDFKILDQFPKAFTHGACSGDIDNDGDLDIFTSIGYFLINDGQGNFTKNDEIFNYNSSGILTCEFYDINKDGFLDLIVGGHTMVSWELDTPKIFWGNGVNYRVERSTSLPDIPNWEVQADFCFGDIDHDGLIEIVIERSGGAPSVIDPRSYDFSKFWIGYRIQILKNIGNSTFIDKTDEFIQDYYSTTISWMPIIRLEDIDKNGKLDLFDSDKGHYGTGKSIRWEQDTDGIFKRK